MRVERRRRQKVRLGSVVSGKQGVQGTGQLLKLHRLPSEKAQGAIRHDQKDAGKSLFLYYVEFYNVLLRRFRNGNFNKNFSYIVN